jgi:hypothetical protein
VGVRGAFGFFTEAGFHPARARGGRAMKRGDGAPQGALSFSKGDPVRTAAPCGAPIRRFSRGSRRAFRPRSVLPGTRLRRALPGFGLSQSSGLSAGWSWCHPDGSRSSPGAEATTLRPQAPPLPRSQGVPEGAPLMGRVMGIYAEIGRKSRRSFAPIKLQKQLIQRSRSLRNSRLWEM